MKRSQRLREIGDDIVIAQGGGDSGAVYVGLLLLIESTLTRQAHALERIATALEAGATVKP